MKNTMIMILSFIVIFQAACSMGSKHDQERDISKTFFWADKDKKGVFKTQSCAAFGDVDKKRVCIKWRTRELDVTKDWDFIVNTRMILINKDLVFQILK